MWTNRDLFRADGRDWFEPEEHDYFEETGMAMLYLVNPTKCSICSKDIPAHAQVVIGFYRERGWEPVDYGMTGSFTDWGTWKLSTCRCMVCGMASSDQYGDIPF